MQLLIVRQQASCSFLGRFVPCFRSHAMILGYPQLCLKGLLFLLQVLCRLLFLLHELLAAPLRGVRDGCDELLLFLQMALTVEEPLFDLVSLVDLLLQLLCLPFELVFQACHSFLCNLYADLCTGFAHRGCQWLWWRYL